MKTAELQQLEALLAKCSLRDQAKPKTWMGSIVRYRAYDRVKFKKRRMEGALFKTDVDNIDETASAHKDNTLAV